MADAADSGVGEPGDETWGDVPFEERGHVGSWMLPSVDPELNLVYVGTWWTRRSARTRRR